MLPLNEVLQQPLLFRINFSGEKFAAESFRFFDIFGRKPVDCDAFSLHFPEPGVLPFCKLADFYKQLIAHVRKERFPLQKARNFAVFKSERLQFFPGNALFAQILNFLNHSVTQTFIKAFFNALVDFRTRA